MNKNQSHRFCVAPMMDWTDRHARYFLRLISKRSFLYTEMITAAAVLRGDRDYLLRFDKAEHPVALQLGGSDPADLAAAARIGEDFGYDEINLNVGCPSDRVQSGRFGACLMREPGLVADCLAAMCEAVSVPVTVKCRIGVDDQDPNETFLPFIDRLTRTPCRTFIVHARKARLDGLSPKENREIPPLDYAIVQRLKHARPDLEIVLNGGLSSLDQCGKLLPGVDGVMLGRAAYQTPYILAEVDRRFFGDETPAKSRAKIVEQYIAYAERQFAEGVPMTALTRHLIGLFQGRPGARAWRRFLSENASRPAADPSLFRRALARVGEAAERLAA